MSELVHRLAERADQDWLFELFMSPAVNHQMMFDPVTGEEFPALLEELRLQAPLFVVEDHGARVAVYRLQRFSRRMRHVVQIGSFAVAPQVQGRGVGRRVIADVLTRLRERGVRRVQLTVAQDNERALAFWQRVGFKIEGLMRGYFTRGQADTLRDEVQMGLLLEDSG